ncbi:hypothetical protein [Streptomyces sp. NPDC000880]
MAELLGALQERTPTDIEIRPSRLTVDGVVFGLIPACHAEFAAEDDWAEPYPDGLSFSAPWDGQYET